MICLRTLRNVKSEYFLNAGIGDDDNSSLSLPVSSMNNQSNYPIWLYDNYEQEQKRSGLAKADK